MDGRGCQSIFFATSKDLLTWTRLKFKAPPADDANVFKYSNASAGGLYVHDYLAVGRWPLASCTHGGTPPRHCVMASQHVVMRFGRVLGGGSGGGRGGGGGGVCGRTRVCVCVCVAVLVWGVMTGRGRPRVTQPSHASSCARHLAAVFGAPCCAGGTRMAGGGTALPPCPSQGRPAASSGTHYHVRPMPGDSRSRVPRRTHTPHPHGGVRVLKLTKSKKNNSTAVR